MNRAAKAGTLVIFAKDPQPGLVKTRFTPPLSPQEAAEFYRCMLEDVLELSARVAARFELAAVVAVHPAEACAEFERFVPAGFSVMAQRGTGLAERMVAVVDDLIENGETTPFLLRGSDSPALDEPIFEEALQRLEDCDLVFCPDRDGGYNLIGIKAAHPELFDLELSTEAVLEQTLALAQDVSLRAHLLEPCFDLDRIDDLGFLKNLLNRKKNPPCLRTIDFADRHALWNRAEFD